MKVCLWQKNGTNRRLDCDFGIINTSKLIHSKTFIYSIDFNVYLFPQKVVRLTSEGCSIRLTDQSQAMDGEAFICKEIKRVYGKVDVHTLRLSRQKEVDKVPEHWTDVFKRIGPPYAITVKGFVPLHLLPEKLFKGLEQIRFDKYTGYNFVKKGWPPNFKLIAKLRFIFIHKESYEYIGRNVGCDCKIIAYYYKRHRNQTRRNRTL